METAAIGAIVIAVIVLWALYVVTKELNKPT